MRGGQISPAVRTDHEFQGGSPTGPEDLTNLTNLCPSCGPRWPVSYDREQSNVLPGQLSRLPWIQRYPKTLADADDRNEPENGLILAPTDASGCANRHGVVRRRCALRVSLLHSSTAGGREYFACGEGLRGDSESRRPDWFE